MTPYQQSIATSMKKTTGVSRIIKPSITDLEAKLLDEKGNLKLLKAEDYSKITFDEFRFFAHKYGIYQFPTVELIDYLQKLIGEDNNCIEIGAGTGSVGRFLDIIMTDSYQQNMPEYKRLYNELNQPTINYPKDVRKFSYKDAIKFFRPKIVLGCWITRRYDNKIPEYGGNMAGIEFDWIIRNVKKFIFVGNTTIHPIEHFPKDCKVEIHYPEGIISRSVSGTNFIAVFQKNK